MLNNEILSNTQKVKWLYDEWQANRLHVDDSFQRRGVWLERHQARLIESILTGYPIPEIYLWARETDAATGHARLSVVDGQQRIRAIMRFIENSLSLRSEYLDVENRKSDFCDTTFETLPNLFKQILWDYQIRIRTIPEVKLLLYLNV